MPIPIGCLVKLVVDVVTRVVHSADIHSLSKMSRHVPLVGRFEHGGH